MGWTAEMRAEQQARYEAAVASGFWRPHACIDCAHAHAERYACANRDMTGKVCQCPRRRHWVPLSYLMHDELKDTTAEANAKAILSLPPTKQLEQVMGTDIATVQAKFNKAIDTISEAADNYAMAIAEQHGNTMRRTLAKAVAVAIIEESLTDDLLKFSVLPLMGKKIGFRTDRDTGGAKPYSNAVLRSCVCEVLLHGGSIDGNEFNVIAGQAYLTQNYWRRKVEECKAIANLEIQTGEVEVRGRDAFVEVIATWTVNGEPREFMKTKKQLKGRPFDGRMVVPKNDAMGRDAVIGKVLARTYKAVYLMSSGAYLDAAADGEERLDPDVIDAESAPVAETPGAANAEAKPEAPREDPQEVADEQARLLEEYQTLIAAAESKEVVNDVVKHAKENTKLKDDTLRVVLDAGRRRWHGITE